MPTSLEEMSLETVLRETKPKLKHICLPYVPFHSKLAKKIINTQPPYVLPKSGSLFLNIKVELNDITHSLSIINSINKKRPTVAY